MPRRLTLTAVSDFFFLFVCLFREWLPAGKSFLPARITRPSHTLVSFHNKFRKSPRGGTELWFVRACGEHPATTHPLTDDARIDCEVLVSACIRTRIRRPVWPQLAALNSHMSGNEVFDSWKCESQAPPRSSRGATNSGGLDKASSRCQSQASPISSTRHRKPTTYLSGLKSFDTICVSMHTETPFG